MSAIFGAVHLQQNNIRADYGRTMKKEYEKCVLDELSYIEDRNVMFGCGTRYITKEDHYERAPFFDKNLGLYFTVDVYLDNREQLLDKLKAGQKKYSDAQIIFELYKKYGTDMLDFVLGSYSFAAYHKKDENLILGCDVTGSRCLYFTAEEQTVRFSTLMAAIIETDDQKRELNERWIVDFLAQDSLAMTTECLETLYNGIQKVQPGEYVKIHGHEVQRVLYWNPVKTIKVQRHRTDEETEKEFQLVMRQSVESALRSERETGIMLSGGLDSTSVASFAAPLCKEKGKELQSYTAVPQPDYVSDMNPYYITNEREQVEKTCQYLNNINPRFLSLGEDNPWDMSDEIVKILELPYKALQNTCFDLRALQEAYQSGCNVMLNGQYGNVTISYGDTETYYVSLLRHGHFCRLRNELEQLHKKKRISRKAVFKYVIKESVPKVRFSSRPVFDEVYVKPEYIHQYDVKRRFSHLGLNSKELPIASTKEARSFIYARVALSQIGEIETKFSLATGVLMKDPTRDKRIISFCLSIPYEQLAKDGMDRRLVRQYLREIIPSHIQQTTLTHKGLQSADVIHRIRKDWERIRGEIAGVIKEKNVPCIDYERLTDAFKMIEKDLQVDNEYILRKILICIILVKFLQIR